MARPQFRLADTAQQVLGGFLLAGPFVVTEEVWTLAANMTWVHSLATVAIVFAVGYGALYEADVDRDPDREADVGGVPLRFVSLMVVAYGAVAVLAVIFTAPDAFVPDRQPIERAAVAARAVGVGAIFSVVGAATADSLF
jgi:uncharacterized membrane protein